MISKYEIFCKIVEIGNFTKVAKILNYSQSAISQTIKAMEEEFGTSLVTREKSGIHLTADGKHYYPYIQSIYRAECALKQKQKEMNGLQDTVITIGTFTSVSRNILPPLMRKFKNQYPGVHFILSQSEYTNITEWIKNGTVDFGFINTNFVTDLTVETLMQDELVAVLPNTHPLAKKAFVSLKDLEKEPFILLDEGERSVTLDAFFEAGLSPSIEYKVYDDYTIFALIEQNLGVSMMYKLFLSGIQTDLCIVPIKEKPQRNIALAWKNWKTMSLSAKKFAEFIINECK